MTLLLVQWALQSRPQAGEGRAVTADGQKMALEGEHSVPPRLGARAHAEARTDARRDADADAVRDVVDGGEVRGSDARPDRNRLLLKAQDLGSAAEALERRRICHASIVPSTVAVRNNRLFASSATCFYT